MGVRRRCRSRMADAWRTLFKGPRVSFPEPFRGITIDTSFADALGAQAVISLPRRYGDRVLRAPSKASIAASPNRTTSAREKWTGC